MKKYLKLLLVGVTLPLTVLISANVNAYIIDLFDDPALPSFQAVESSSPDSGGSFNQYGSGPILSPTIFTGYRDIHVINTNSTEGNATPTDCVLGEDCSSVLIKGGTLAFSNDTNVIGRATIQWDGNDASNALNYDQILENFYTQDGCGGEGCDRFQVDVVSSDLGFTFLIGVYTDATHFTEFELVSSGNAGVQTFLFSDFTSSLGCNIGPLGPTIVAKNCGGGGTVDFAFVDSMQLILNTTGLDGATARIDLDLNSITKVPEPGMLGLLGLGLATAGIVLVGRRRSEKAVVAA
jgi:PEP-CTERM motif-containing protein